MIEQGASSSLSRTNERIIYKLCVLVHNCLYGTAPRYLQDVIQPVAEVTSRRRLRSASSTASNMSFSAWGQSLRGCWTTRMEQFTSFRRRLLVTSSIHLRLYLFARAACNKSNDNS